MASTSRVALVSLVPLVPLVLASAAAAQARIRTVPGEAEDDFLGYAVAGAGDVDRDGFDDFIAGAVYYLTTRGYVRVVSGRDGAILFRYEEELNGTGLGSGLAGGADVDGDGWPDFAIGAYWGSVTWHYGGSVRVCSGRDGSGLYTLGGPSAFSWFGLRVEFCGDVDGDGLPDLVTGSFGDSTNGDEAGSAQVYRGLTGELLYRFLGDGPGSEFGRDVSGAGDIDGDGRADILVSGYDSDQETYPGVTRIYSGADGSILREHVAPPRAGFGHSVATIGDLDGDGKPEYAVGAHLERHPSTPHVPRGSVRVFSGADGALLHHWWGEPRSTFGFSVDGAGDVDRDGVPDIVVGAPNVIAPIGEGRFVRVYSGATGELLFEDAEPGWDQFGNAVARAGDVNADGFADVLVADYASDEAVGPDAGIVYILGGGCPAPKRYCVAAPNSAGRGAVLESLGGPSVTADDLVLQASGLPPGGACLLYYGATRAETPLGDGLRCVGPPTFRLGPPLTADPEGRYARALELGSPPASSGPGAIEAGSTWNFQLWYRDPASQGAGFNLSDALAVTFHP